MQFLQERRWVVVTGCQGNESGSSDNGDEDDGDEGEAEGGERGGWG